MFIYDNGFCVYVAVMVHEVMVMFPVQYTELARSTEHRGIQRFLCMIINLIGSQTLAVC